MQTSIGMQVRVNLPGHLHHHRVGRVTAKPSNLLSEVTIQEHDNCKTVVMIPNRCLKRAY